MAATLPTIGEMEAMLDGLAELAVLYPEDAEPISLWFEWVERKIEEISVDKGATSRLCNRIRQLKGQRAALSFSSALGAIQAPHQHHTVALSSGVPLKSGAALRQD